MSEEVELALPRVSVPSLLGIEVTLGSPAAPGAEELIDRLYDRLRFTAPRRERRDQESIAIGDDVVCDLVVTVDGNLLPGGSKSRTNLEMRDYPMLPGLVDEIVGMKPFSKKTFKLTLPANYPAEEYAGREAEVYVNTHQVSEVEQPDMEDAQALRQAGLGESLAEAMALLATELDEEKGQELLLTATQGVLAEFGRRVKADIPDELIDSELLRVWEASYEEALLRSGFDDQQIDEAWFQFAEDSKLREETRIRLKTDAGLRALAEQEEFAPKLDELDQLLGAAATVVGVSQEEARLALSEETELSSDLVSSSIRLRAVEYLMSRAKIKVLD